MSPLVTARQHRQPRARLRRALQGGLAVLLLTATALSGDAAVLTPSARAEDALSARRDAARAAAEVAALRTSTELALLAYDRSLASLATTVTTGITADADADTARLRARTQAADATARVRAVYMSGGVTGLYASLLGARGIDDFAWRVSVVQRVVRADATQTRSAETRGATLGRRAAAMDLAGDRAVVTARDVAAQFAALERLLAAGEARLARLSARAQTLAEAERAAAALAALRRRAAQALTARVAKARATAVPVDFFPFYRSAALTCPKLSWSVLAAIGQVETGHGRNVGPSSAGAMGPMQFLPSTFAGYATDGDKDGDTEILDPADSIYSAARYLCANGAGRSPAALRRAIWHYNHAEWYVQLVLRIAGQLAPPAAAPVAAPPTAATAAPRTTPDAPRRS